MQLHDKYVVKTESNSSASIIFPNGNFISIGPNSNITISKGPEPISLQSDEVSKFSRKMFQIITKVTSKGIAGMVGMKENIMRPILLYPINTTIRTLRPNFTWLPVNNVKEYQVLFFNLAKLLWEISSDTSYISFPTQQPDLEYGKSYFWRVDINRVSAK